MEEWNSQSNISRILLPSTLPTRGYLHQLKVIKPYIYTPAAVGASVALAHTPIAQEGRIPERIILAIAIDLYFEILARLAHAAYDLMGAGAL